MYAYGRNRPVDLTDPFGTNCPGDTPLINYLTDPASAINQFNQQLGQVSQEMTNTLQAVANGSDPSSALQQMAQSEQNFINDMQAVVNSFNAPIALPIIEASDLLSTASSVAAFIDSLQAYNMELAQLAGIIVQFSTVTPSNLNDFSLQGASPLQSTPTTDPAPVQQTGPNPDPAPTTPPSSLPPADSPPGIPSRVPMPDPVPTEPAIPLDPEIPIELPFEIPFF